MRDDLRNYMMLYEKRFGERFPLMIGESDEDRIAAIKEALRSGKEYDPYEAFMDTLKKEYIKEYGEPKTKEELDKMNEYLKSIVI